MSQPVSTHSSSDNHFDQDRLHQVVEDMLAEARKLGASAAEAGLSTESGLSVSVRMGDVETVEHNRDKGMGVTVYFGLRKGSASTSDFSSKAIRETVRAACDIARYTEEDKYAGLADAAQMASDIPDLDLYHPWNIAAEQAIELALRCEDVARQTDPRIQNSEGASVSSHEGMKVYGNSHGFIGAYASSRHSLSCSVIGEQDGAMQRDYWYSMARDAELLESAEFVGEQAAKRTVSRLGARRVPTGQMPVIFQADIARGLLGSLIRAIGGGAQYRKASFLLGALDKQVFPSSVTIDERPYLKGALGSAPFDHEGVAPQERALVSEGILRGYVLDSYGARRLGMQSTGNSGGVHNLYINHGDDDLDALLKTMGTGLLITEVMGQGVNIVTGDYSRGAAGFMVENGEILYPVEEFTLASRLQDMFMGLQAVGNDVDRRGNILTGSWLIDKMTIAGE